MILNHVIVLFNVFGLEAGTRILFLRLEPELWPLLKTMLLFLDYLPDRVFGIEGKNIISSDIALDQGLIDALRAR